MPTPLSDDALKSLTKALMQGRKIEAIKLYREFSGLGLKESKDAAEELESSLREKFPEKFANVPKRKGCLGAATGMVLLAAIVIVLLALSRR
jgi:ribosomal protein L7/L12